MLTRLYIDNYKTLSNFELTLGRVQLLMGRNGTGKSSVLDVLAGIRALAVDGRDVEEVFPPDTLSAWSKSTVQRFELELQLGDDKLAYRLEIDHDPDPLIGGSSVHAESLQAGDRHVFTRASGKLRLFDDDGSAGRSWTPRLGRSALDVVSRGSGPAALEALRDWLSRLLIVRPNPAVLGGYSDGESPQLLPSLANFASWYRNVSASRPIAVATAQIALREVLAGFEEVGVELDARRHGQLRARMRGPHGAWRLDFDKLSDGQRVLFALYVIRHAAADARLLLFDEPENFVSLDEIQPWLFDLLEAADEPEGPQVLLISHHPELLNPLAPTRGIVLSRSGGGPTRTKPFASDALLPAAEVVARRLHDA